MNVWVTPMNKYVVYLSENPLIFLKGLDEIPFIFLAHAAYTYAHVLPHKLMSPFNELPNYHMYYLPPPNV